MTEAASAGAPCPSNAEIADLLGYMTIDPGLKMVGALARRGLIAVESKRNPPSRVVTVVATGKSTAPPQPAKWHPRRPDRRGELAERVAEGASLSAAARAMGITQQRASQIWRRIRDDLGWQAC